MEQNKDDSKSNRIDSNCNGANNNLNRPDNNINRPDNNLDRAVNNSNQANNNSNSQDLESTSTSTKDEINLNSSESVQIIWNYTKQNCEDHEQKFTSLELKTLPTEIRTDIKNIRNENALHKTNSKNGDVLRIKGQDIYFDNENENSNIEIDSFWTKFTFIMFGVAGVLNWSVLLNCILSIFTIIYNYPAGADTILLGYFVLSVISGILRIRARNISPKIVYSGIIMLFMTNILLPLTVQFFSDLTGIILLHIIGGIIGLAVSFIVANGYAYACILPKSLTGYVVAGNGLAGLTAFLVWQFLTRLFFDIYSQTQLIQAVWILFSFCFLCMVIHLILFTRLIRKLWFKKSLTKFQTTVCKSIYHKNIISQSRLQVVEVTDNVDTIKPECRPLLTLISLCIRSLTLSAITFFISYSLFPNIGPYDWIGTSLQESSMLVGIYQTFDFLGRYLPNFGRRFTIPSKIIPYLVISRLFFYPLFISFAMVEHNITSSFLLQFLLILTCALSNGLIGTQCLSNVPRCVETISEKGTMGMVMHLSTQIAISLALIFSKVLKLTLRIHFH